MRGVAEQVRPPLVGVATDETVEVVEAHAGRPLGERPSLTGFIGRGVMVLAKPRRRVAVVAQDAANRCIVHADDAVVTGEAGGLLGDHPEAHRVVVAPSDQRRARRRAQRGREHPVVAQTVRRDAIHGRRRDHAAEGAWNGKAGVVGQDEQDVGCAFRRYDAWRPPLLGLQRVILDHAAEFWLGRGELCATDRGGGAGRAKNAGDLRSAR